MKRLAKALLARTPYRLVRDAGANRFQAIDACLRGMQARGFSPAVVIDGGAHLGAFSVSAAEIFPEAKFHLIEPQPACAEALEALARQRGFEFHRCALAEKAGRVPLLDTPTPETGVHVSPAAGPDSVQVAARTLDELFAARLGPADRVLLKMDLQGYEMHALQGGIETLKATEAILTEVSFFAQAYEPSIAALTAFLDAHAFRLYDIAALTGRFRDNRLHQGDFVYVREGSPLLQDSRWH